MNGVIGQIGDSMGVGKDNSILNDGESNKMYQKYGKTKIIEDKEQLRSVIR